MEAEERAAFEARQRSEQQLQEQKPNKPAPSGAFITPRPQSNANPGSGSASPQAEGPRSRETLACELAMVAGAEAVFRVCVEDYGEYVAEFESMKLEAARVGQLAVDQGVLSAEKLAKFRDEGGLTGRGLMMLQARKHVNPLGACEETANILKLAKG